MLSQARRLIHSVAMRPDGVRTGAASIVVVAVAGCLLTGCASQATGPTGPSAFAQVSGSAVPVSDEVTALCAEIVKQQLPQEAAEALAEASGYTTRVGSIDGTPQPTTKDYSESRMTFDIAGGLVTGCIVG